ncbi:OmpA family protein [Roseivirga spongicola]|uniref:OmpA family protein n=1 Tax=Roseivirga spongicola TaxID=333140 RepID=UPI002AC900A8|nr:OmpA family protein [Roseivirga spongicola]WPZ12287.1 OmpA family protein [Roseivirga spongicola]
MRVLYLISFLLLTLTTLAQEELHTRRSKLAEAYTEAKGLVDVGNLFKSEEILKDILKKDESFDEAILLLHEIHIKRDQPERANAIISNYSKEVEPRFLNRLLVIQANYHYQLGEYEQARKLLSNVNSPVYQIGSERVTFLKESIEFSIKQLERPLDVDFEKLPNPLNQFEQQYFPSATVDGRIVFTIRDRLGRGDEDLYTSYYHNESVWSEPVSLSDQINSERNEGAASISADGRTLVFTSCNRPDNIGSCDLYVSYFRNDTWTKPLLLGPEVNSTEWDSQPSLTANGKTLYFVSMREGGLGKQDIWMSEKVGDNWSPAVNLGPEINTVEDDCSPFIYLDGKTLIFSTRGRVGMGGYDLFKSIRQERGWTRPENLGSPINNAFDQIGYCISADQWAYFSSSNATGRIFLQRFKVPDQIVPNVKLKFEEPLAYGRVVDAVSLEPLSADVFFIYDSDTISRLSNENGQFLLTEELNYSQLLAMKRGYRNSVLSKQKFLSDSTIRLQPFQEGESLLQEPILFDFDSYKLREEVYRELDRLAALVSEHPELQIEIQGYTDSVGSSEYNQTLSEKRAKSVYDYLVRKIGRTENLSYQGYGEILQNDLDLPLNDRKVTIITRTVVR